MRLFDVVLITASSERQAGAFRTLIARRQTHGLYPRELTFEVVADPPGGRIGTGGGTLWALERLLAQQPENERESFFDRQRILLIHAGGESRRLPAYAPEGKLFAPLPVPSSALLPPVVLDLQLGLFFKYPWRKGEVVISSGDVVLDFDAALLPEERSPVFGFAKAAALEQGSRHGVFRFDNRRERVIDYYQKAPVATLQREAVIEGTLECALDIGLVSLAPAAVRAFVQLGRTPVDGGTLRDALAAGRLRFDLYLEVLSACLAGLEREAFWRRVGPASGLPQELALRLYDVFHPLGLGGTLTRATTFVHVGSLAELPEACRTIVAQGLTPFYEAEGGELRPFEGSDRILHNSVAVNLGVVGQAAVLVEGCASCSLGVARGGNLLVGIEQAELPFDIPAGISIEERRLDAGRVFVILSASDSLKAADASQDLVFCGRPLAAWLAERGLNRDDVLADDAPSDLFEARLFCLGQPAEFLAGYLHPPDPEWTRAFRSATRLSLAAIQEADDPGRREDRRIAIRQRLLRERFKRGQGWLGVSARDFAQTFADAGWYQPLSDWLAHTDDALLRLYRARLLRSIAPPGIVGQESLPEIEYVSPSGEPAALKLALKEDQIVWARAPVRLDLAGGWTDTPPYTLRFGGRVVNVAVNLNGQPPIQVFCRRTPEPHVRLHSIDLGRTETITSREQLGAYRDPASIFALPKAALCLLGLDRLGGNGAPLVDAIAQLGSGLDITMLCAVPKGSGLGTSSILAAALLAALSRLFGRRLVLDDLIRQVLQIEQMLTTGGGWQDQIGGAAGGVKCIESRPGLRPQPAIHQLDPYLFQERSHLDCCTLFYTGFTRLAKNILAEVVDQVNANEKAYRFTLTHMAQLALDAKHAIERRDRMDLARIVSLSWEANKRVHPSTTNAETEELLRTTRPHFSGAKLLGAGGGGYMLFISRDVSQADELREMLSRRFEGARARLVDPSLSAGGLEVSVS
jgi:galactokinase/mevalonate kinase-like predicted kinase